MPALHGRQNVRRYTGWGIDDTTYPPGNANSIKTGGGVTSGLGIIQDAPPRSGVNSQNENTIATPANMIAPGDSNWDLARGGDPSWSSLIAMYGTSVWPLNLHSSQPNGIANLTFVDGHSQGLQRIGYVAYTGENPIRSGRWSRSGIVTTSRTG